MKRSFRLVLFGILVTITQFSILKASGSYLDHAEFATHIPVDPEAQEKMDGPIVTLPIPGILCPNSAVVIAFEASGTFNNDNVFTAELSDASGSFANPTVIGSVPGPGTDIPPFIFGLISAPAGTGYRIRVVSSSPAVIGSDNGTNLVIQNDVAPGIPSVTINGPTDFCFGSATTFLTSSAPTGNLWFPGGTNTNPFIGVVSSGCYYTLLTAPNGCTTSSVPVCINVNTPIFTFLAYSENDTIVTTADTTVTICEGDSAQIAIIVQGGAPPFDIFYTFDGLGSVLSFTNVGEPFGGDHIFRFYTALPGVYSVIGLTDNFPTNCGSNGNSGVVTIQTAPPPVTSFSYNPFCGSPSQPPVPAQGFLGGGVFAFDPEPGDGATINSASGVVSGAIIGSSYTVKYTVQGPFCEASSSASFTVNDSDIVAFNIEPFCANAASQEPVEAPGFVGGGVYSFATAPVDGASISSVTGIISGATPLATYIIRYTSPNGLCQATSLDTVTTLDSPVIDGVVVNTLCGDSTGSITASVSGGQANYSYNWSAPGGNTATLENIPAGSYTLTVTDQQGCQDVNTFSVINTNQPVVLLTPSNATCGTSNGSIQLTVSDSPGPFSFLWNDNSSSQNRSGLPAGNYSVAVFDSTTGCSVSSAVEISNEGAPLASFTVTNSLCAQSVGAINVTVTGGTGTITHSWSNGATSEDLSGLPAGTYTDTIRDENNCQVIIVANIINENQFTASSQVINPTCGNPNGGSVNISINGGQSPFTFEWTPNTQTITEDAFNLPAGTYSVKITGASQCSTTVVSTILPAVSPVLTFSKTDATCGNEDGAINLSVSGGSGSYIYEWSGGETTEDIDSLATGTYNVLVRDAADTSCKTAGSVTIIFGNEPSLTFNVTPTACADSSGAIDLSISNGSGSFGFNWTGPGGFNANSEDLADLAVGIYQVTVFDSLTTCEVKGSATVQFNNAPTLEATVVNTRCGLNNGLIDVTITGGQNPAVTWLPGNETTQDLVNLSAGTYEIFVSDDNNCEVRDTFVVAPSITPSADLSFLQPSCSNDTGSINLTLFNIATPVVFVWRKNEVVFANTEDVSNLGPGTFRVTATDANGCVVRDTAVLAYQNLPELNSSITNTTCGLSEGAIDLEITGGTPDYTVSWTGPEGYASSDEDISNLAAGCYNATVTDQAGCEVSLQSCVVPENAPEIAFETASPSCNLDNGSITAVITGGVQPYSFSWGHSADTTATLNNLAAGSYTITVIDANTCEVTASVTLTNTGVPSLTASQVNTTCGNATGSIDIQVNGGQAPYTYLWTPGGETSEDINGLASGTYSVTVSDTTGCETQGSFTIENSDAPQISFTQVNTTCGNAEGSIDIAVSPSATYTYTWTGSGVVPDSEDQTGLAAGTYKVVVVPVGSQCSDSLEVTIINSNAFTVDGSVTNATCGLANGAIDITLTGGEAPFNFTWSCSNSTTEDLTALSAGTCTLTVADDAGCEVTQSFDIINIAGPEVTAALTDASCGACNGAIDVSLNGGTAPFTFLWNDQASAEDRTELCGGTYVLTVTDSNNCAVELTYTINSANPPAVIVNGTTDTECGESFGSIDVSISGGTTPYTISWTGPGGFTADTEDISSLFSGLYELTVTDSLGCDTTLSVTIINTDEPTLSFEVTDALCGQVTGSIVLTVIPPGGGPLPPGPDNNTYSWTGPNGFAADTRNLVNVPAGTYEVTVTSGACVVTGTATINNSDAPTASITADRDTICEGESAVLTITLTGNPPFTFEYTDGVAVNTIGAFNDTIFTFTVDPSNSTTYSMVSVVEDADTACFGSFPEPSVSIVVRPRPVFPVITASGPLTFCAGDSVILNSSYQTGNVWSTGETSQSIVVKTGGNYVVTISNEFDCAASDTVTVNVITIPNVGAGNDTTVCLGTTVQLQATGADDYLWSPSIGLTGTIISNPVASPPETTTYVVTGTNACGSGKDTVTISINPVVIADLGGDRSICDGDTLKLGVANVPGAIYVWGPVSAISGPTNEASATVLVSSTTDVYLTTTNLNGCVDTDTITISVSPLPQAPVLSVQGNLTICEGQSVIINSTVGTFVRWYRNQELIAENINNLEVSQPGDYTVEAYGGTCPVKSNTIAVVVNPLPFVSIGLSGSNVLCQGDCIDLVAAQTTGTINWITPDGSSTEDSISACGAGTYVLEVSENGCTVRDSVSLTVNSLPEPPVISPAGPISICEGQTATLTSSYQAGNQWLKDGGHLAGFTSNYILLNSQGSYSVRYTDENGCSSESVPVEITIKPVSPLTITSSDSIICSGSGNEVTLTASTGFETYVWSDQQTGSSINVTTAGTYEVTATNSAGCTATAEITIEEGPALELSLFSPVYFDDYNVTKKGAKDGSIDLTVDGGTFPFSFEWSNQAVTEDLNGLGGGIYVVKVTDLLGCTATDSINLKEPGPIKLPNGFTPNADGFNDRYIIKGIQGYPGNKVTIFNRWGNIVYSVTNYVNDWEGISNDGNLLPDGTYFIVVDLNDNDKLIEGFIDLRRN
jgi:gliding motility-associated-like protein